MCSGLCKPGALTAFGLVIFFVSLASLVEATISIGSYVPGTGDNTSFNQTLTDELYLNQSEAGEMFVNITGDNMTGSLLITDAALTLWSSYFYSPTIFRLVHPRYNFSIFPDEDILTFGMGDGAFGEQYFELAPPQFGNRVLFWKNLDSLKNISAVNFVGNGSALFDVNVSNAIPDNQSWNASAAGDMFVNITGDTMTGNLNMMGNNVTNLTILTVNTDEQDYMSILTVHLSDDKRYGLKIGGVVTNPTSSPFYGGLATPALQGTTTLTSLSGVGFRGSFENQVSNSNAATTTSSATGLLFTSNLAGTFSGDGVIQTTSTGMSVEGKDGSAYTGVNNSFSTIKGAQIYAKYEPGWMTLTKTAGNMTVDLTGVDVRTFLSEDGMSEMTENINGQAIGINSHVTLTTGNILEDTGWRPQAMGYRSYVQLDDNIANSDFTLYNYFGDMDADGQSAEHPYFLYNNNTNSNVKNLLGKDNIRTYWGTGEDVSIVYDGVLMEVNTTGVNITGLPTESQAAGAMFVCRAVDGHLFVNDTGC